MEDSKYFNKFKDSIIDCIIYLDDNYDRVKLAELRIEALIELLSTLIYLSK